MIRRRRSTARTRADSSPEAEGLGLIIVGTQVQPRHPVRVLSAVRAVSMMTGRWAVSGRALRIRHTSVPLTTGRLRSRMIRSAGAPRLIGGLVAAADNRRLDFPRPLECVLDQRRDVVFVLHDQDPRRPPRCDNARPCLRRTVELSALFVIGRA